MSLRKSILLLVCTLVFAMAGVAQVQIPTIGTALHTFGSVPNDGAYPAGSLSIGADGALYGTTFGSSNSVNGGSVYKINRDGTGYMILRSFLTNDTGDDATVLRNYYRIGLNITRESDGVLYGVLVNGGTNAEGAVFKMNTDGTQYTNLHSFGSADGLPRNLTIGNDGVLYGSGNTIFKLFIDGSGYTLLHTFDAATDGDVALGKLIQGPDGELYGTAFNSGPAGNGTIFKTDPAGTNFQVIYSFPNSTNGRAPVAGLLQANDGELYGVATTGGTNNLGTLFRLATDGTGFQLLYNFGATATDGIHPYGQLVQGANGLLYGTANSSVGAAQGNGGTVFEINPDGTDYATLYSGTPAFGNNPFVGVVLGSFQGDTGVLYGAASSSGSGSANFGTIFSVIAHPFAMITPAVSQSGNNGPVVFWPQWALGYQLQATTNLTSPNWQVVTNGVAVTGVQLTNPPAPSYYRLVYPN